MCVVLWCVLVLQVRASDVVQAPEGIHVQARVLPLLHGSLRHLRTGTRQYVRPPHQRLHPKARRKYSSLPSFSSFLFFLPFFTASRSPLFYLSLEDTSYLSLYSFSFFCFFFLPCSLPSLRLFFLSFRIRVMHSHVDNSLNSGTVKSLSHKFHNDKGKRTFNLKRTRN